MNRQFSYISVVSYSFVLHVSKDEISTIVFFTSPTFSNVKYYGFEFYKTDFVLLALIL